MKYSYIRPESKVKGKLGRGKSVVLFDTPIQAAYAALQSLLESYGYTADQFSIELDKDTLSIIIRTFNDRDYYRWLDIVEKPIWYIEVIQDNVLNGKAVSNVDGGVRYDREEVEIVGFAENMTCLVSDVAITIDNVKSEESMDDVISDMEQTLAEHKLEDAMTVPLTEIIGFGDDYDLPVGGIQPKSVMGRFFMFLGSLVNRTDGDVITERRKPITVFESQLGGHIAIYKSLTTNQEVDIALFSSYGDLINVFSFQDGSPYRNGINGFTIEDLIGISTWRIIHLNSFISAEENVKAIAHLNDAVEQLYLRSQRRSSEG